MSADESTVSSLHYNLLQAHWLAFGVSGEESKVNQSITQGHCQDETLRDSEGTLMVTGHLWSLYFTILTKQSDLRHSSPLSFVYFLFGWSSEAGVTFYVSRLFNPASELLGSTAKLSVHSSFFVKRQHSCCFHNFSWAQTDRADGCFWEWLNTDFVPRDKCAAGFTGTLAHCIAEMWGCTHMPSSLFREKNKTKKKEPWQVLGRVTEALR